MFNIISDIYKESIVVNLTIGLITLLMVLLPFSIVAGIKEQKAWDQFAITHNCRKVGHIRGHVSMGSGIGVTSNGGVGTVITTTTTPNKTGFACNDGVTYWR